MILGWGISPYFVRVMSIKRLTEKMSQGQSYDVTYWKKLSKPFSGQTHLLRHYQWAPRVKHPHFCCNFICLCNERYQPREKFTGLRVSLFQRVLKFWPAFPNLVSWVSRCRSWLRSSTRSRKWSSRGDRSGSQPSGSAVKWYKPFIEKILLGLFFRYCISASSYLHDV